MIWLVFFGISNLVFSVDVLVRLYEYMKRMHGSASFVAYLGLALHQPALDGGFLLSCGHL